MIKFLIVLYNKNLLECETSLSIINWDENIRSKIDELYIWNNSPLLLTEDEKKTFLKYFENTKISFYEDCINHPLSYVYSTIIKDTSGNGILVLWDHDSHIPEMFVDTLIRAEGDRKDINLFLPQVYFNDKLVSPAKMIYFWGMTIDRICAGPHHAKHTTAINSGMAIRCSYLKNVFPGYDMDIKFYGTDNDFMFKYRTQNDYLYVLPIKIEHELNSYSMTDLDDSVRRYRDIKNGLMCLSKNFPFIVRIMCRLYIFLESSKHNIINRTLRFWT